MSRRVSPEIVTATARFLANSFAPARLRFMWPIIQRLPKKAAGRGVPFIENPLFRMHMYPTEHF